MGKTLFGLYAIGCMGYGLLTSNGSLPQGFVDGVMWLVLFPGTVVALFFGHDEMAKAVPAYAIFFWMCVIAYMNRRKRRHGVAITGSSAPSAAARVIAVVRRRTYETSDE